MKKSDLYLKISSDILFPFHEWLKSHPTKYWLNQFRKMQHWPVAKQHAWQRSQLSYLLQMTCQYHPFYRDFFGGKCPKNWEEIPFTDKTILKKESKHFLSNQYLEYYRGYTSGSTGVPLYFYQSKYRVARDIAAKWRCLDWLKLSMGTREAVVWGSHLEWKKYTFLHRLRDKILNTRLFPAISLEDESLGVLAGQLQQYRPEMIMAYPTILEHIVKRFQTEIDWKSLEVKAIITTAEELLPRTKVFLSSVFDCPVINSYGAREAGFIAQSCLHGNLHIMAENIFLEVIDPATSTSVADEQEGEIVITNLSSDGYPIIRYRTGDLGSISHETCACGISLPILKKLSGRKTDFLLTKTGKKLHLAAFSSIFSRFSEIEQFKIVQYSLDKIDVFCAPETLIPEISDRLMQDIKSCLDNPLDVRILKKNLVQESAQAKHRFIENRMSAVV